MVPQLMEHLTPQHPMVAECMAANATSRKPLNLAAHETRSGGACHLRRFCISAQDLKSQFHLAFSVLVGYT
jgi:hypothetical protein